MDKSGRSLGGGEEENDLGDGRELRVELRTGGGSSCGVCRAMRLVGMPRRGRRGATYKARQENEEWERTESGTVAWSVEEEDDRDGYEDT
jgi:hypothetical protein